MVLEEGAGKSEEKLAQIFLNSNANAKDRAFN